MKTFQYTARDKESREISGEMDAASAAAVSAALRQQGFFPIVVSEGKQPQFHAAEKFPAFAKIPSKVSSLASKPIRFKGRYPALEITIRLYHWSAVVVGFCSVLGMLRGGYLVTESKQWWVGATVAAGSLISGFLAVVSIVAIAEVIRVFLDIEQNTRETQLATAALSEERKV